MDGFVIPLSAAHQKLTCSYRSWILAFVLGSRVFRLSSRVSFFDLGFSISDLGFRSRISQLFNLASRLKDIVVGIRLGNGEGVDVIISK